MDRLVRARVLLTEAESLGVTIDHLVAAAADRPRTADAVPTFAAYVDVVERAIGPGRTAETYRSYWRLAVTRLGDGPINAIGSDDFEDVLADAVARAQRLRPGTEGRASRENCVAALRAVFARAQKAGLIVRNPAASLEKPRRLQSPVVRSTMRSCKNWSTPYAPPATTPSSTCSWCGSTWSPAPAVPAR